MTVKTPIVKLNRDELWNLRLLDIEACGWVRRYIEKTRELRRVLLADPRKEHERKDLIAQDMGLCRAFCDYVETVRKLTGYDKLPGSPEAKRRRKSAGREPWQKDCAAAQVIP